MIKLRDACICGMGGVVLCAAATAISWPFREYGPIVIIAAYMMVIPLGGVGFFVSGVWPT